MSQTRILGLIAGIILLLSSPVQADLFINTTATGGCFGNSSILGGHSSKADSFRLKG